jgi:uncharacterized membrane protein
MIDLGPMDLLALAAFAVSWLSYHLYSEYTGAGLRSLNSLMNQQRFAWMERMATRDNRIIDSTLMSSLQNGTAFFASTSLLAIGGTLSALGATDAVLELVAALPFDAAMTRATYELKVLGLALIFTYSFFKLVWSYRLFNYTAILIGATPLAASAEKDEIAIAVGRASRMNVSAAKHFNRGLRAFFYALAYLGWFAGPVAFIVTTLVVTVVMWRRQHHSDSLAAVRWSGDAP